MPQKSKKPTSTSTFFPPNLCRSPGTPASRLNPGNISNLHKKTRDLTPEWIEGLSLRCAKNVDVNQTIYAEWMMGNSTPVGFRLGGMLCRKDSDNITVSNFPNCLFPFIHYPLAEIRALGTAMKGLLISLFPLENARDCWQYESKYARHKHRLSVPSVA